MTPSAAVRSSVALALLFGLMCPAPLTAARFDLLERREEHWAWRPVQPQTPPPVRLTGWARQPVDLFLLARLELEGLAPAPPADPRALLRRVHFDLIGLPPSPEEVERFVGDTAPDAFERVVDGLLASPRFGERWARHWLDLVRYAETLGHEFDYSILNAWRYRDYVIRALNSDLPHDQFVREHIAGDLLAQPRRDSEGFNESIIGTGFFWLGQQVHSPVDVRLHQAETIDNQVDVLSKTFMALTVSCARCHDHKFDAISTRDFYALYGILSSSRYAQRILDPDETFLAPQRELHRIKSAIRSAVAEAWAEQTARLDDHALLRAGQLLTNHLEGTVSSGTELADFTGNTFGEWRTTGYSFGTRPAGLDEFTVRSTDDVPALQLVPEPSAHSGVLSRSLEGSLRSPTFTIQGRYLHVRAAGQSARFNVVIDNFTIIRDPIYGSLRQNLNRDQFAWTTLDLNMWTGHRAYIEFNDMNAGDPGTGSYGTTGYAAVSRVLLSDNATPPAAPSAGIPPASLASAVEARALTSDAIRAWAKGDGTLNPVEAAWLRHLLQSKALTLPAGPPLDSLFAEYGRIRIPEPARAPGMVDGTGLDEAVFVRGDPHQPGNTVPRRFLEALGGGAVSNGSGRLELAERVLAPSNPFASRVMVNRVWLHLFGRGLVPTPDDFGVLGEPPSHPELLDWLAHHYREECGWSTKKLIRLLVTSSAYRMSSRIEEPAAESLDPLNRLLHRMPVRRLEGETIRDALLFVAGELNPAMHGPSVPVHLTPFMEGRGRPGENGPEDGAGRRSIYVEVRRNFLSPMMLAFDSPTPLTTIGQRTRSNVPAQALTMMNDPFVARMAERWGGRILEEASPRRRVRWMFLSAFGRPPSEEETGQALAFVKSAPDGERAAWTELCHVLFNAKEFVFVP